MLDPQIHPAMDDAAQEPLRNRPNCTFHNKPCIHDAQNRFMHTHTHIYCTYACMRYTHTCAHACACSYNTTAHIVLNIQARVPCALKRLSEWLLNAGSPTNVWHGTRASWIAHEYCTYVLYCSVLCHSTHGPRTRVTKLEQIMTPYTSVVDQRRGRDTPMPTSEKN
jgi:hypothetical protein